MHYQNSVFCSVDRLKVMIPLENFPYIVCDFLRYCKCSSNLQSELVEDLRGKTYHWVDVANNISNL